MSYSRHRGIAGERAYAPRSLAEEKEDLEMYRQLSEERAAAKQPPITPPAEATPQART